MNDISPAMQVGSRLVELCKNGQGNQAMDELYADSIVSLEGPGGDEAMQRIEGIEGVRGKAEWWENNNEVHGMDVEGPFCGHRDDQFVVRFGIDVTPTGGERMQMTEVGIYTVVDGKVAQEEFLYLMG